MKQNEDDENMIDDFEILQYDDEKNPEKKNEKNIKIHKKKKITKQIKKIEKKELEDSDIDLSIKDNNLNHEKKEGKIESEFEDCSKEFESIYFDENHKITDKKILKKSESDSCIEGKSTHLDIGLNNLSYNKNSLSSFQCECIIYDYNKNSYKGKFRYENFRVTLELGEEVMKKSNYNQKFYTFGLLEIKNFTEKEVYFWQGNSSIEIKLTDNRYFYITLKSKYPDFLGLLKDYVQPGKIDHIFVYAKSFRQRRKVSVDGWNLTAGVPACISEAMVGNVCK